MAGNLLDQCEGIAQRLEALTWPTSGNKVCPKVLTALDFADASIVYSLPAAIIVPGTQRWDGENALLGKAFITMFFFTSDQATRSGQKALTAAQGLYATADYITENMGHLFDGSFAAGTNLVNRSDPSRFKGAKESLVWGIRLDFEVNRG